MALNSFLASASSALAPESGPPNPSIKANTAMDRIALAVLIPGGMSVVIFIFGWFSLVFIIVSFPLFHVVSFLFISPTRSHQGRHPYRTIPNAGVDSVQY